MILQVPEQLQVISITPVQSTTEVSDGTKQVVFEPTLVMSTYLVFFAVFGSLNLLYWVF